MNNEMIFFILFGVLCAAAGYVSFHITYFIKAYLKVKRRKVEFPYLESASKELLCKGPHSYEKTKLVFPQLPADDYLVCKDCGFIASEGGEFKLNAPAMEVHKNSIKRRQRKLEVREKLVTRRQILLDEIMNSLIKRRIEKFDGDLHKNIPELQQFFRLTVLEAESLYVTLKKDLDDLENHG